MTNAYRLIVGTLALGLLLPAALIAADTNLSSDLPIEFDGKTNSLVARQNATFVHDDLSVTADEIRYNQAEDKATATGNARINFKGVRIVAAEIIYHIKSSEFSAKDFRMGYYPYLIKGKSLTGNKDTIVAKDARLYASQTGTLAPSLLAHKVTIHPGNNKTGLVVDRALFGIGQFPLLPIPYATTSLSNNENLEVKMRAGQSGSNGFYLQTESLYPVSRHLKAGANADLYSKRGWLLGPRLEWKSGSYVAKLSSGYIDDSGSRGTDSRGVAISNERGFVDFKSQGHAGPVTVTNQVQYWSDSEVIRDFRNDDFRTHQAPDTFTEAVWPIDNAYVSAFVRRDINNFDSTVKSMPEVRFDKLATPIANTGIYWSWMNGVAHLEDETSDYNRFDSLLELRRPFVLKPWWTVTPVAGVRQTYYDEALNGNSSVTRTVGEAGFDSEWTMSRTMEVKNDLWQVDGLRHLVQPTLQYRYLPSAGQKTADIIKIEDSVFYTNPRPLDFFNNTAIDDLQDLNIVRLGLKQSLQTRQTGGQFPSRDLINLELYQDYDITTAGNNWGDFYAIGEASPARWISVGSFERLNWDELTWKEHRIFVTLKDADYRSLTVYSRYLIHDTEQYGINLTHKITNRLTAFTDLEWNARLHDMSDARVGVEQHLLSGWRVAYAVERSVGDSRENDTRFTVRFHWFKF